MSEGRKNDLGKLRYDLISQIGLAHLADVYTRGANKYNDRNWERGLAWSRVFAAMQRHAARWLAGEDRDPVDGQKHLASVAWCAFALMEYETTHPELDDRPKNSAVVKELLRIFGGLPGKSVPEKPDKERVLVKLGRPPIGRVHGLGEGPGIDRRLPHGEAQLDLEWESIPPEYIDHSTGSVEVEVETACCGLQEEESTPDKSLPDWLYYDLKSDPSYKYGCNRY